MSDTDTDAPIQDGGDTPDRPDWLPENFTRPEDLAKSYSESRKEMDRLRSELDTERQQFAAALERIESSQQPAPVQDTGQANQLMAAYQQAVETGDAAAQLSIQLALNQQATAQLLDERLKDVTPRLDQAAQTDRDLAFRMAEGRVSQAYGDEWEDLSPKVDAWIKAHPAFLPAQNSPDAWESVVAEAARTVVNEEIAEKYRAEQSDRAAKLSSQVGTGGASGRYSTVTDEKKQEWSDVKNADVGSYAALIGRKNA